MLSQHAVAYRRILRELKKARETSSPSRATNNTLSSSFRRIFEKYRATEDRKLLEHDIQNVITFMCSQREYKALLERYNPLIDLTAEERIHATARRVGLDMPVAHKREAEE